MSRTLCPAARGERSPRFPVHAAQDKAGRAGFRDVFAVLSGDSSLQAPWSQIGLPAISLPSGLSSDGLPIGTQLAAAWFDEERLLAVARWVEDRLDPLPSLG